MMLVVILDKRIQVKLAVVGMGAVGKSTLIARLVTGAFIDKVMTVGFDVETWSLVIDDTYTINVSMFDFGGQEQFRFFQAALIAGAKVALIVFDCTTYRTLMGINEWVDLLVGVPRERMLLIGNKIDAPDKIPEETISAFARDLQIEYICVSAKTGLNFDELKNKLAKILSTI